MQDNKGDEFRIDIRKVFHGKSPVLAKMIPGFIMNYLKRIIHEDELNDFLSKHGHLRNIDMVRAGIDYLGIKYQVHNEHNIPESGRFIFASNHPLGGLDGIVFTLELSKYFKDVKFPVNDILLNIKNMSDVFLPVNKHGRQARESALMIEEAYMSDVQILYFPAGLCSRKQKGEICDLVWHKSFIAKAIKHKRDIVPVYFSGKNSNWFYNLARLRKAIGLKANIEMLYLSDEMFKQKDKEIHLIIGEPLPWQTFDKSKTHIEWADWVKSKSYELAEEIS